MKTLLKSITLGLAALALVACGGLESTTPEPASETYRLDLSSSVVVAFVEGLTPEMSEKVAYVTHVPHRLSGYSGPRRQGHTST